MSVSLLRQSPLCSHPANTVRVPGMGRSALGDSRVPGLIGLLDCNSFYVSCERLFQPRLIGQPVGVLSNNDGCVISLSRELKALGVTIGTPAFQLEHLARQGR